MSRVTNVILAHGDLGNPEARTEQINKFFANEDGSPGGGFVHVEDKGLPNGWYGGTKFLECELLLGAFNYLNLDKLIAHLRTIQWTFPDNVQLIVKGQDDDRFTTIDIFPEACQ